MAATLLVDTDILIDAAREIEGAVAFLEGEETDFSLGISVITEMELVTGCRNKAELQKLDKFLKRFHVLLIRGAISNRASKLLREYRLSHGLLIPDALIAATALESGLRLATKNIKDFRFIDGLKLAKYPES